SRRKTLRSSKRAITRVGHDDAQPSESFSAERATTQSVTSQCFVSVRSARPAFSTVDASRFRGHAVRITPQRVLIVLLGAIGDVTRALPLLERLRRGYPRARLMWAVEPAAAPLVHNHPALDEVLIFDRRRGAAAFLPFLREVRARRADLTLDLQ